MAIIHSGNPPHALIVEPTALGVHGVYYNSHGIQMISDTKNIYSIQVGLRISGTIASGQMVYALYFPNPEYNIYIRKIVLRTGFYGTAAATSVSYKVIQTWGSYTANKITLTRGINSDAGISNLVDAEQSTSAGLTAAAAGQSSYGSLLAVRQAHRVNSNGEAIIDFAGQVYPYLFKINPYTGIGIQLGDGAILGDVCNGYFEWEER